VSQTEGPTEEEPTVIEPRIPATPNQDGEPIEWFKRQSFVMAPNQTPKWHALSSIQGVSYIAVCGYVTSFINGVDRRDKHVKAKGRTCTKCLKKLEQP
jgi:hypothetical protein